MMKAQRFFYYSPYFRRGTDSAPDLVRKPMTVSEFFVHEKEIGSTISHWCKSHGLLPYEVEKEIGVGWNAMIELPEHQPIFVSSNQIDLIYEKPELPKIFKIIFKKQERIFGWLCWMSDVLWTQMNYPMVSVTTESNEFKTTYAKLITDRDSNLRMREDEYMKILLKDSSSVTKAPYILDKIAQFQSWNAMPSSWIGVNYGMCAIVAWMMKKHKMTQKLAWQLAFFGEPITSAKHS